MPVHAKPKSPKLLLGARSWLPPDLRFTKVRNPGALIPEWWCMTKGLLENADGLATTADVVRATGYRVHDLGLEACWHLNIAMATAKVQRMCLHHISHQVQACSGMFRPAEKLSLVTPNMQQPPAC